MASFADAAADSGVCSKHRHDLSWSARPVAGAKKLSYRPWLGALSRSPGSRAALRWKFLLPRLPLHAGAERHAPPDHAALPLAAPAAQQVDPHPPLRARPLQL